MVVEMLSNALLDISQQKYKASDLEKPILLTARVAASLVWEDGEA